MGHLEDLREKVAGVSSRISHGMNSCDFHDLQMALGFAPGRVQIMPNFKEGTGADLGSCHEGTQEKGSDYLQWEDEPQSFYKIRKEKTKKAKSVYPPDEVENLRIAFLHPFLSQSLQVVPNAYAVYMMKSGENVFWEEINVLAENGRAHDISQLVRRRYHDKNKPRAVGYNLVYDGSPKVDSSPEFNPKRVREFEFMRLFDWDIDGWFDNVMVELDNLVDSRDTTHHGPYSSLCPELNQWIEDWKLGEYEWMDMMPWLADSGGYGFRKSAGSIVERITYSEELGEAMAGVPSDSGDYEPTLEDYKFMYPASPHFKSVPTRYKAKGMGLGAALSNLEKMANKFLSQGRDLEAATLFGAVNLNAKRREIVQYELGKKEVFESVRVVYGRIPSPSGYGQIKGTGFLHSDDDSCSQEFFADGMPSRGDWNHLTRTFDFSYGAVFIGIVSQQLKPLMGVRLWKEGERYYISGLEEHIRYLPLKKATRRVTGQSSENLSIEGKFEGYRGRVSVDPQMFARMEHDLGNTDVHYQNGLPSRIEFYEGGRVEGFIEVGAEVIKGKKLYNLDMFGKIPPNLFNTAKLNGHDKNLGDNLSGALYNPKK